MEDVIIKISAQNVANTYLLLLKILSLLQNLFLTHIPLRQQTTFYLGKLNANATQFCVLDIPQETVHILIHSRTYPKVVNTFVNAAGFRFTTEHYQNCCFITVCRLHPGHGV